MGNTFFKSTRSRTVKYNFHKGSEFRSCETHSYSRQKGHNRSVLGRATDDGHFGCVAALIEAGANVNERDGMGQVALHSHKSNVRNNGYYRYRVTNKPDPGFSHWQCVRLLIKAGANLNVRDKLEHRTPLHEAIQSNHDVCVEFLIEAGADVNAVDLYGDSPVVQCADLGNSTCLKKLIGAGADVNKTSNYKKTALQKAASKGSDNHRRCLELLIEAGADVNKPDVNGLTPLMSSAIGYGITNGTHQIKILLSAGANVNKRNMNNQTALELHISTRHYYVDSTFTDSGNETAHLLIAAGERIDGTTVPFCNLRGEVTDHAPVPAEIIPRDPLCLKNICRETIGKRLIEVDPHTNLFHKIPQLPLPPVLHSYLLYEESLDRRELGYLLPPMPVSLTVHRRGRQGTVTHDGLFLTV